jgi:putative transposase
MNNPLMPLSFTRTLRLKVRREAYPWLTRAAFETNQVFNYCNEASLLAATRTDLKRKWLTGFDLCNLTSGATKYFEHIGADTVQSICVHFAQKRIAAKKLKLRWRASGGAKRALGWIPFKAASVKRKGNSLRFAGKMFRVFNRDYLGEHKFRDGCFAQDACGDWYLCIPVHMPVEQTVAPREEVGIDLGVKTIATTSDGEKLEGGRWTHGGADKLAMAQRRGHKKQAKRIHRRVANQRKDALHKFSRKIVDQYQNIIVGDVSSKKLVKTKMAKSVLDSGWGMLKTQLQYKGQQAGRSVLVVNESYSTRACSGCGALTGPAGVSMLVVRQWVCSACGDAHDRDVNAAKNILAGSRCRTSVRGNESSPLLIPPSPLRKRGREAGIEATRAAA